MGTVDLDPVEPGFLSPPCRLTVVLDQRMNLFDGRARAGSFLTGQGMPDGLMVSPPAIRAKRCRPE